VGVLKGSIGYAKFYVRGALPDDMNARYLARIRARGFKPLAPEDEGDAAVGWMPIERPFDDEVSFRAESVFFGSYVNLAMRVDRWKFPTSLVKSKMAAAERAHKAKTGKERLSRAEKAELRDLVERRLRRDGVPVTKVVDLTWNVTTQQLRFFGKSKMLTEHLYELFEKTFSMKLLPAGAYTTACALDLPKSLSTALGQVDEVPLHA
jgi:recombination associated protein RdgC